MFVLLWRLHWVEDQNFTEKWTFFVIRGCFAWLTWIIEELGSWKVKRTKKRWKTGNPQTGSRRRKKVYDACSNDLEYISSPPRPRHDGLFSDGKTLWGRSSWNDPRQFFDDPITGKPQYRLTDCNPTSIREVKTLPWMTVWFQAKSNFFYCPSCLKTTASFKRDQKWPTNKL